MTLVEQLGQGKVFTTDGATGSMLHNSVREARVNNATELVDANPGAVRTLHEMYRNAGTTALLTCTFNGNAAILGPLGYSDKEIVDLNMHAVRIAREVMGPNLIVAGDIGPTGLEHKLYYADFEVTSDTLKKAFLPQAKGLLSVQDGIKPVDLIVIETMHDPTEAKAAIAAVREFSRDIPVALTMSFDKIRQKDDKLFTMSGVSAESLAKTSRDEGLLAVGANCGLGPEGIAQVLKDIRQQHPDVYLWAKPNAGIPGKNEPLTEDQIRETTEELLKAGAQFIGWCCMSDAEYIRITAEVLQKNSVY